MILVDVNILLYAEDVSSPHHTIVCPWWDEVMSGPEGVGLCWHSLNGFLRVATNLKIHPQALTPATACAKVSLWLARPNVLLLEAGPNHWKTYESLIKATSARGNLLMDAHLAALAIEHNCALASCDADFAKFPGLRWINPLAP